MGLMHVKANWIFLATAARDFKRTGAVAPSSRVLAGAMTRELARRNRSAVSVLEAGGGTGSITREIARHLSRGDHLDVYEIDSALAWSIRQRLRADDTFRVEATIRVHNRPIENVERGHRYDFVISGLPFNNFKPETVRETLEIFRRILKPGGICTFYEYIFARGAAKIIAGKAAERKRVDGVGRVVKKYVSRYEYRHEIVLRNLPPALVHHIRFDRPSD
jgi:phosphatidylethanolamine/phosphatidyl-N-methylethanolamine N-methyltransferase